MRREPTAIKQVHQSRRTFVSSAVTGVAAVTMTGRLGGESVRNFPTMTPPAPGIDFELLEVGIADLQQGMVTGRWTSERLCELYLERISQLDGAGPTLRQVLDQNPEARRIAAGLDAERRAGKSRGPLHGVPIVLKDNVATADGMTTTAGSLALVGSRPDRDAFLVERLRAAGAVLLA